MTALDLDASWNLVIGDALRVLMDLPTGCADAVVTDPPYSSGGFTRGDRMGSSSSPTPPTTRRDEIG